MIPAPALAPDLPNSCNCCGAARVLETRPTQCTYLSPPDAIARTPCPGMADQPIFIARAASEDSLRHADTLSLPLVGGRLGEAIKLGARVSA